MTADCITFAIIPDIAVHSIIDRKVELSVWDKCVFESHIIISGAAMRVMSGSTLIKLVMSMFFICMLGISKRLVCFDSVKTTKIVMQDMVRLATTFLT
jgi:hypothetical protein